jgi:hypothetical protein
MQGGFLEKSVWYQLLNAAIASGVLHLQNSTPGYKPCPQRRTP